MSELSAAAAAALGVPEAIVQRSAAARATETGMTVDEVLAVWAGGGELPASAPSPTPEEPPGVVTPADEPAARATAAVTAPPPAPGATTAPGLTPVIEVPAAAAPAPSTPSGKPPVLVGEADNPIAVLVAVVALFVAFFLVGLVGPALPTENPGARSSDLPYSEAGLRGRHIYQSVGCASCHTQMVRPVVADVDLGAVTLADSNQVLGTRRFGPDLSNVGARISAGQVEAIIGGLGGHPSLTLSSEDLDALVTYLLESRTMGSAPGADAEGEAPSEEEPAGS